MIQYKIFYLWRFSNEVNSFEVDIGRGIPGWHIECLSIIKTFFEDGNVDIHFGGRDLKLHHNNEIIQNIALGFSGLSKRWIYIGAIKNNRIKMSKSEGNEIYLSELINRGFEADEVIISILQSKYSKDIDICNERLLSGRELLIGMIRYIICSGNREGLYIKDIIGDKFEDIHRILYNFRRIKPQELENFLREVLEIEINDYYLEVRLDGDSNISKMLAKRKEFRDLEKWSEADCIKKQILERINCNIITTIITRGGKIDHSCL